MAGSSLRKMGGDVAILESRCQVLRAIPCNAQRCRQLLGVGKLHMVLSFLALLSFSSRIECLEIRSGASMPLPAWQGGSRKTRCPTSPRTECMRQRGMGNFVGCVRFRGLQRAWGHVYSGGGILTCFSLRAMA